jgi:sporulation protein YlmC with PRC-barrel domain
MAQQPTVLNVEADLLDRQLVDADGRMVGKVDDLELSDPPEGEPPHVTAILVGPAALGPRLSAPLARWWTQRRRRRRHPPRPAVIPFGEVRNLGMKITVSAGVRGSTASEDWLRDHVIDKIPGARHADQ